MSKDIDEERKQEFLKFHHDSIHRREDLERLIREMPPLDVYRTPPNKENIKRLACMTMSMRANEDLRSYVVVNSEFSLNDIPEEILVSLPNLELWKSRQSPEETLFFFDREHEAGYYDDTKLIVDRGWLLLENDMGWDWHEYRRQKERQERWEALSEEDKAQINEESRKELAQVAELALKAIRHDQRRAIIDMFSRWLPWNWFK